MYSYTTLLLLLALAEVFRRCCMALIAAFTGPLSKIPGPFLMKLTHIPWIFESVRGNIMNVAPKLFKKYGDVVRVGPRVVLFASKDAAQKIIIEEDLLKSPEYEWLRADPKITNLITERDRVAYRQKRRLLSPGFSISYLNGLEPLMLECVQALEETLDLKCKEGNGSAVVDIYTMLSNLTSDVMAATSFGGSFNSVRTNNNRLKQLFLDHLKENAVLTNFPLLKWLPFKHKSSAELDKLTNSIVAKRQSAKDQSKKDLLQIILDTHKSNPESFTEKHVMEEMRLFMIAGSDTTGTSAAFTVLQLVNNPEKLQSLKMEIDTAFPSKDDRISFANTQDLPYLNAVINETLRVMPIVVSGIPRWTTETTMIDNYEIPAGTIATVWVSALFKDPRIWPDAEAFVPERWLGKYKGAEIDRKAYLPFSGASRSCIGQQFALKEMRLALATLVRRYDLTLIPGQSHEMRVHIVPYFTSGKYLVAVKSRD